MKGERPILAAIYARVSTDREEQKHSPEHQVAHCKEIALENNWEVRDEFIYFDHGLSGTELTQRTALQQLIRDGLAGKFQIVLFKSLSRFARNEADAYRLRDELLDAGLRIVADEDRYDSNQGDELKFGLFTMINAERSREISRSSRIGLRQSTLKGNFTGNIPPLGYKKAGKRLAPDEETAWIVRKIFYLYTSPMYGMKKIVNELNVLGIPSQQGGKWCISTVRRILTNEVYVGTIIGGRYGYTGKGKRKRWIEKKEQDWVVVKEAHSPIIEQNVFDRAQEIRIQKGGYLQAKSIKRGSNAFLGILKCAGCQSSMVLTSSTHRSGVYRYLICSKRRTQGYLGCENDVWIPYESLFKRVCDYLSEHISKSVTVEELVEFLRMKWVENGNRSGNVDQEIQDLHKKWTKQREYLHKLRIQHFDGKVDGDTFEYESVQIENAISVLQARMDQLEAVFLGGGNKTMILSKHLSKR
jgi:site-specific DNA recombinase